MHLWRRDALAKSVTASHMPVCAAAAPEKKRAERLCHVKGGWAETATAQHCNHKMRFKLRYEKCMAAKCTCHNYQDQTALGDSVNSRSESGLDCVNLVNDIPFPLSQNVLLAVAQVPLIPTSPPHQAHSIKRSHTIWIWQRLAEQRGDGELYQQKIMLNWGQHAELKLHAISFIHINLGKVAKCAKLVRLIDSPPLSPLTLSMCLSPHLTVILTCTA